MSLPAWYNYNMILITGATGSNGAEIIKRLSAQGVPVRAMVREAGSQEKTAAIRLPHVEIVEGDFNKPKTLLSALDGIERAFLLTPSSEQAEAQQKAFVEAAKQSGLPHIVKLSQFAADPNSPVRFLRYHAVVENAIKATGMAYTFLRPNLFMQGLLNFAPTIKAQNAFYAAIGKAKVSMVDVRDIADCATAALTKPGRENKTYDLTGPEALSHTEAAQKISDAVGREIKFVDISPDAMHDALLSAGFPPYQADGLLEDYAHYARGEAAIVSSGVQDAAGHAPRSFDGFCRDYADAFS